MTTATKTVPIEKLVEELRRLPEAAFDQTGQVRKNHVRKGWGALTSAMPRRKHLIALLGALLLLDLACKDEPEPVSTVDPSERVAPSPVGTSQTVLQKTFALKATATFPFEIPAHATMPHLHGIFEAFAGQAHGASDDSANIDFLIMNQGQQDDFASNRPSEALFTVEASHNQAVNFDLPASLDRPVKYYLVFRNPEGGKQGKVVEANFHVDF